MPTKTAGFRSTATSSSVSSSRSSGVVNDACCGPRRPTTHTCRTRDAASSSSTSCGMSVDESCSRAASRTRATSTATFPTPKHIAVVTPPRCWVWASGWPEYHATNSRAETEPCRSSPGTARRRSSDAPAA